MKRFPLCLLLVLVFLSMTRPASAQLMRIGQQEVSSEEFLRHYRKNTAEPKYDENTLRNYLNLFVIYKLKILSALDAGIQDLPSVKRDLSNYRDQLAQSYLTDRALQEKMLIESYEHMKQDVHARQIMIRLSTFPSPQDTLQAYRTALRIRDRLMKNEAFEAVIREEAGKGGQINIGSRMENRVSGSDLKYFTVFAMPYPIEQYAYSAKVGDFSYPVRSDLGYHIIQVLDRQPALGKIRASQIFLSVNEEEANEAFVKQRIDSLYHLITTGQRFEEIAQQYSDDKIAAIRGGLMAEFNVSRMDPEFIKQLYTLPDQVISKPFRAENGYHIVMVHSRSGVESFESLRSELLHRLNRDVRSQLIQRSFIENLLKTYPVHIVPGALQEIAPTIDSNEMSNFWEYTPRPAFDKALFTVGEVAQSLNSFGRYVENAQMDFRVEEESFMHFLTRTMHALIGETVVKCESQNLEQKYPEFKQLFEEYRDGILFFEMTDRMIWSKSSNDTSGLMDYYDSQKHCFMWPPRINALIFKYDVRFIDTEKVRKFLTGSYKKRLTSDQIVEQAYRTFDPKYINVTVGIFEPGNNKFADRVDWEVLGMSKDIAAGGTEKGFVNIYYYYPPTCKSLDEVRGVMVSQFQAYLEEVWVKDLRRRYPLSVNEAEFRKLLKP